MWNNLTQWLSKDGRRPPRRRRSSHGPRGRFEILEARSLLSANYGDIDTLLSEFRPETRPEFQVVAIVIVADVPPPIAARFVANMIAVEGDAPWENLSLPGPHHDRNLPLGLDGGPLQRLVQTNEPPPPRWNSPPSESTSVPDDIGGVAAGGAVNGVLGNSALASNYPGGESLLGIQGNSSKYWYVTGDSRPPLPPATGAMLNYFTAFATEATSISLTSPHFIDSTAVREAVFDGYASDELLLASDSIVADEKSKHDDLRNELDEEEDDKPENPSAVRSLFDEAAHAALDALARERRAIDAVLASLHDIEMPTDEYVGASASDYEPPQSSHDFAGEHWQFSFDPTIATQPAFNAEGGMVLLESSGDANSNAYDLTAAFVADLESNDANTTGVEAALGMYQAIDVGASELIGSARSEQPIAKPAVTAPASVSAENAPVKKSERPS